MLNTGMLFNTVVCWFIAFFALIITVAVLKAKRKSAYVLSYGFFWLLFSLLWLLVGLRSFFAWQDNFILDKQIFLYDQIFVFLHLIPLSYYVSYKLWHRSKASLVLFVFYCVIALVGLSFLWLDGAEKIDSSFFMIKYKFSARTWVAFSLIYAGVMLGVVVDCVRRFRIWLHDRREEYKQVLLTSFSLFIYGILGYIDEIALWSGWEVLILRCLLIIPLLITIFAYSDEEERIIINPGTDVK